MSRFFETRLWAVHLWVVVLAAAVYGLVPGPAGRAAVFVGASALTTVAVVAGIALHRPAGAAPWRVLAAGAVILLGANAVWIGAPVVGRDLGFPSVVDGFFLAAYGLLFVALVLIARARTKGLDRFGILDALIVATGLGTLSWVFVVGPSVRQPGLGVAAQVVTAAYPLADLLLLGVAAWLVMGPGHRRAAFWLLSGYVVLQLVSDTGYAITSLHGTFSPTSPLVSGWILAYAGLGAALLHPTLPSLARPASAPGTSRWRLATLTGTALVCPVTLVVQTMRGHHQDAVVLATLSAALFGLVLARVGGLMSDVAERRRTEEALRREAGFVRLLHAATSAASASDTLEAALAAVVDQICAEGWCVGQAMTLDAAAGGYGRTSHPARFDELGRLVAESGLTDPSGVAGRVVAAAAPVWLHPLPKANFAWARAARRVGIRSAFGFPVRIDGETVAVLQFFSDEDRPRDDSLLHLAADMGIQLGRVVERIRAREALTRMAYEDPLTGLPNRSRLMQVLSAALAPGRERPVAVLFCDLDDFKFVNDSFGHDVGDEMLVAFAARLRSSLPDPVDACRLGGDEFAVVADAGDEAEAEALARAIVTAVEAPFVVGERHFHASISIGLAVGRPGSERPDELLRRADIALHHAKAAGKNRYESFAPHMLDRILARVEMEADLRSALDEGQFTLHYQPKFCGRTGQLLGVEALVRWNHPVLGLVSPAQFIPIAEDSGLIVPLGAWVLNEACRNARRWQGTYGPTFTMAVNVSALQLRHSGLVPTVIEALARSGLSAGNLILEITESSLADDVPWAADQLLTLKRLGVQLAIDDFGTGHSSLDRLRHFPIDEIKIDRSFVSEIESPDQPAPIVAAIVAMGHGLGHRVVAEGVETAAQLTYLGRQRCDQIQGYILARPMPADELEAELERRGTTRGPQPAGPSRVPA